jgi:hypothetical protein
VETEEQVHELMDGSSVTIVRINDRYGHKYALREGGEQRFDQDLGLMPSVTSLTSHVDAGAFQIGMNWAMKVARENGGDLEAPKRVGKEALDQGNALHDDIDSYIKHGTVNEESPAFVTWLREIGSQLNFNASELFVYHRKMVYGGTVDAIGMNWAWDWKTKDPDSYAKNGGSLKDHVQLAAYVEALRSMESIHTPVEAKIAYVMRDGSGVDVVDVDIEGSFELFINSRSMKYMVDTFKHVTKPKWKRA